MYKFIPIHLTLPQSKEGYKQYIGYSNTPRAIEIRLGSHGRITGGWPTRDMVTIQPSKTPGTFKLVYRGPGDMFMETGPEVEIEKTFYFQLKNPDRDTHLLLKQFL